MITGKLNVSGKACSGREAIVFGVITAAEKRPPSLCWSYINAAWRPKLHPINLGLVKDSLKDF